MARVQSRPLSFADSKAFKPHFGQVNLNDLKEPVIISLTQSEAQSAAGILCGKGQMSTFIKRQFSQKPARCLEP